MLLDGGNAVDAAVAMAAALNVVEPGSTGIGGDMFALIWNKDERRVVALNGSGRSGAAANPEDVRKAGYESIPNELDGCAFSVSVPGTVHGWETALANYGRMTLSEVLKPAIDYALNGYAVSEVIARGWQGCETKLRHRPSGSEMLRLTVALPNVERSSRCRNWADHCRSSPKAEARRTTKAISARR